MIPVNEAIYQGKLDNFCAAYAVLNGLKLISHMNNMQARIMLNEMFYYESLDKLNWLKVIGHETDYHALVTRMLKRWEPTFHYTSFCPFVPHNYEKNIFQTAHDNAKNENSKSKNAKNKNTKDILEHNKQQKEKQELLEGVSQKPTKNFLERVQSLFKGEQFNIEKAFEKPEISLDTVWSTLKKYVVHKQSTAVIRFCRFIPGKIGPIVDHWTTLQKVTDNALYFFDCSLEETGWYIITREKLHVAPFASIPPQALAIQEGYKLSLAQEEFAVICPENIHIISMEPSPFLRR